MDNEAAAAPRTRTAHPPTGGVTDRRQDGERGFLAAAEALLERHDNWAHLSPKQLARRKKFAAEFKREIWWTVRGCPIVYKTRGAALAMATHMVETQAELAALRAA